MKVRKLSCFSAFKCVADKCLHNCCSFWEIDIDKKTLKKYKKYKGAFKPTLDKGVDYLNGKFIMNNGRCAFLNENNLCAIYINMGEKFLCQVCADHPRFRSFFNGFVEQGIGVACEVGARQLLEYKDKLVFDNARIGRQKGFNKDVYAFRDKMLDVVQNRENGLNERLKTVLSEIRIKSDVSRVFEGFINVLLKCEFQNSNWVSLLKAVDGNTEISKEYELPLEQFTGYLFYRHLPNACDGTDLRSITLFSVMSVFAVYCVAKARVNSEKTVASDTLIDVVREYSREIEYSDKNLDLILDFTDENLCLQELIW